MLRLLVVSLLLSGWATARPLLVTLEGGPAVEAVKGGDPTGMWLKALTRFKVPAVLFVRTERLEGGPGALGRWVASGHEIGTMGHKGVPLVREPLTEWRRDLQQSQGALADLLARRGAKPVRTRWYRFPDLAEGSRLEHVLATREGLRELQLRHLDATVDRPDDTFERGYRAALAKGDKRAAAEYGADWLAAMRAFVRRAETQGDRLAEGGEAPQILRLDLDAVGGANVEALLAWLVRRGYRFVGPDEILKHPLFDRAHEYVARRGVSLFWRLRVSADTKAAVKEVSEALFAASEAWSRGDMDGYLSLYAENARLVSGRTLVEGRRAIGEKYRTRYPSQALMGRLGLTVVRLEVHTADRVSLFGQVEPLPPRFAIATVEWTLLPKGERGRAGQATLVFIKGAKGWRLIEDHSSTGVYLGSEKARPRPKPKGGKPPTK